MTKLQTTAAHGFGLALATIQHGPHPAARSPCTIAQLAHDLSWPKRTVHNEKKGCLYHCADRKCQLHP